MLSRIQQHVGERRSHLPRRAERAMVITPVEHGSAPIEDPIHCPSQACAKALHSVRQRRGPLRFDDKMDVVVLERILDDAEVCSFRDRNVNR